MSGCPDLRDLDTGSTVYIHLQRTGDQLAIGFGIETNGDLDLVRLLADAILRAATS